jgi:hypothetical protein
VESEKGVCGLIFFENKKDKLKELQQALTKKAVSYHLGNSFFEFYLIDYFLTTSGNLAARESCLIHGGIVCPLLPL